MRATLGAAAAVDVLAALLMADEPVCRWPEGHWEPEVTADGGGSPLAPPVEAPDIGLLGGLAVVADAPYATSQPGQLRVLAGVVRRLRVR